MGSVGKGSRTTHPSQERGDLYSFRCALRKRFPTCIHTPGLICAGDTKIRRREHRKKVEAGLHLGSGAGLGAVSLSVSMVGAPDLQLPIDSPPTDGEDRRGNEG